MRRLLVCGLLGCAAASLVAAVPCRGEGPGRQSQGDVAEASESAGTPRISFATSSHDFGHQIAGEDLETTFDFKNVGDGVLRILQVKGG